MQIIGRLLLITISQAACLLYNLCWLYNLLLFLYSYTTSKNLQPNRLFIVGKMNIYNTDLKLELLKSFFYICSIRNNSFRYQRQYWFNQTIANSIHAVNVLIPSIFLIDNISPKAICLWSWLLFAKNRTQFKILPKGIFYFV